MVQKHTGLSVVFSIMASVFIGSSAVAGSDLKAAIDHVGKAAVDARGKCVVTKWSGHSAGCGEKIVPVKKYVPVPISPAAKLSREQKTIYFDFNKSSLDAEAVSRLDSLISALHRSPNVKKVKIVGYADHIGSASYNQALSGKRAQVVADFLRSKGIANQEVTKLRALGELSASDHCRKSKTRALLIACLRSDRRVEVEIEYIN